MKKKVLRVVVILFVLLLISFIFSVVDAFVGNPISKAIASHKINDYVKENYHDLDLELSKTSYNFKFDEYFAIAQSKTSADTHFDISYSKGNVTDTYSTDVLSGWNTFQRLDEEFNRVVEQLITDNLPYDYDMLFGGLDKKGEYQSKNLSLDMKLDYTKLPLDGSITAYIYTEDVSWENVAKISLEIDKLMKANDIRIDQYDVILEPLSRKEDKTGDSLGIYEFPQSLFAEDNLPQIMKGYYEKWEAEGDAKKNGEIENSVEKN